jgi:hypothetical protein
LKNYPNEKRREVERKTRFLISEEDLSPNPNNIVKLGASRQCHTASYGDLSCLPCRWLGPRLSHQDGTGHVPVKRESHYKIQWKARPGEPEPGAVVAVEFSKGLVLL